MPSVLQMDERAYPWRRLIGGCWYVGGISTHQSPFETLSSLLAARFAALILRSQHSLMMQWLCDAQHLNHHALFGFWWLHICALLCIATQWVLLRFVLLWCWMACTMSRLHLPNRHGMGSPAYATLGGAQYNVLCIIAVYT